MRRLWAWLFASKPYQCTCGKSYRNATQQGKCVWKHALDPGMVD